jgi:hypothetical protein
MVTTLAHPSTLSPYEPCDRCGAAGVARITLGSGGHLNFCGHHLRAHRDRLAELSAEIRLTPSRHGGGVNTDPRPEFEQ